MGDTLQELFDRVVDKLAGRHLELSDLWQRELPI